MPFVEVDIDAMLLLRHSQTTQLCATVVSWPL